MKDEMKRQVIRIANEKAKAAHPDEQIIFEDVEKSLFEKDCYVAISDRYIFLGSDGSYFFTIKSSQKFVYPFTISVKQSEL